MPGNLAALIVRPMGGATKGRPFFEPANFKEVVFEIKWCVLFNISLRLFGGFCYR